MSNVPGNRLVARRFFDELCNQRKLEVAPEILHKDYVYHDPQIPNVVGPEAMAQAVKVYQDTFDGFWQIEEITGGESDKVTVRWTGKGHFKAPLPGLPVEPNGSPIAVSAISVLRIADGKIAEHWCVWDTLSMMRQIGAMPA